MKAYDYDAVAYDSDVYCIECLPKDVNLVDDYEVYPIFADSEWDYIPVCCVCSCEHNYVNIIG